MQKIVTDLGLKFYSLDQIDPFSHYTDFLAGALLEKRVRFLSAPLDDTRTLALQRLLPTIPITPRASVMIPFSIFAASSLGASVALWVVLLFGVLRRTGLAIRRGFGAVGAFIDPESGPFFSLAIAISVLSLGALICFDSLSFLWRFVLTQS
jgi:hypothetical protein